MFSCSIFFRGRILTPAIISCLLVLAITRAVAAKESEGSSPVVPQAGLLFYAKAAHANNTEAIRNPHIIGGFYLNVYPEDVLKGTPGNQEYDPAFEEALRYGARVLR